MFSSQEPLTLKSTGLGPHGVLRELPRPVLKSLTKARAMCLSRLTSCLGIPYRSCLSPRLQDTQLLGK